MTDIQRAIETLKEMKLFYNPFNKNGEIDTAISAIQELQAYRATGLTPRMVETLKENDKRSHRLAVQRATEADEYSENCQRWRSEARIQAAAAGEMRIALEMRLEAIETLRKINLNLLSESDDNLQRAILGQNRIQYEEQKSWLEALLQENIRGAAAGQYAEDGGDQPVLMPAT